MPWHHRDVTRIRVEAPGSEGELIEIRDGEGIVFGRAPDARPLDEPGIRRIREHPLRVPSVSSNHAFVWVQGQTIRVRDLSSRNGSWLRVPHDATVELATETDVQLRLGFPVGAPPIERPIDPPHYNDDAEFGAGVAHAVQVWLANHNIRVHARATREEVLPNAIALPLASGETLVLQPAHTVDEQFHVLMIPIARYVAAQNAVYSAEQDTRNDGMVLASSAIRQVHRRVVEAALQNTARLVLLGPSGTGKERLARAYHRHLGRSGPLVTVNCAMLSRDRIVADLFGAEAGAYTGAQKLIVGAVERADGGTLFLDEIGEMPIEVQSQLLRFLDTGEFQRLGATGVNRTATVAVVAATNRDLRTMVNDGTFRLDLFFRIALEVIEVPSLRERFEDAVAYFASQQIGSTTASDMLQPAALEVLRHHPWPGNFRELVNLVKRLPRDAPAGSIDVDAVRRLLGAGALRSTAMPPVNVEAQPTGDWLAWLRESANAYCAKHGDRGPTTWGEMTVFIEQYLKPYALVHMAGVADADNLDTVAIPRIADAVKADRGTVIKQLRRYFESHR